MKYHIEGNHVCKAIAPWLRFRITTAVTGPPPKNYDFKTRVIGGSG
jgi:hypothetical protein